MQNIKWVVSVILVIVIASGVSSCKKIREDVFIKGLWKMNGLYIDTIVTNQMNNLPHFTDGNDCCEYRLDFQDNDLLLAYYFTYDTLESNSFATGTWKLVNYNTIYLKLGEYIDGEFKIYKPSRTTFEFKSNANHVAAFDLINPDLDTTTAIVEIEKI
ncbi:MAG: hypothetical protein U0V74_16350 [Chitinophagales bacterium]